MRFFLLRMKVNGIKNIDKEIQIDFFKSSLRKNFDSSNSHVKAVYGPNGAGKTGLIYAVELYKNLICSQNYLILCNANDSLNGLINQTNKKFSIEMIFAIISNKNELKEVFAHFIAIEKIDGRFLIVEEKLSKLSGQKINMETKYNIVYHVKDGNIVELFKNCNFSEDLKKATMNLLPTQSLCHSLMEHLTKKSFEMDNKLKIALAELISFALNITVVLQDSDTNYIDFSYVSTQITAIREQQIKINNDETFYNLLSYNKILQRDTERVLKTNFEKHEKYISNLCAFIKVFKNDLIHIDIKKDENGDYYECEDIMVYKDGKRINKKYESSGIKKIIKLYSALCELENGYIVFIDEFDANIHDVLLKKLIEYIMEYASGQFIFTTHNLGPMEVLQKAQYSIDFLSSDSRIVSWKRNGNYSAASLYSKGLIEYSPFNIEAFSFLGTFGDKKE